MQCPHCQMEAVAAAVFCNHCGTLMPAICPSCQAGNPPESRFCHVCGLALSETNIPPAAPHGPARETGIKDIGIDLKTLGTDVAAYSSPRIKRGSAATVRNAISISAAIGRSAKAVAVTTALHIKALAQRFKPYRPEPPAPAAIPTYSASDDLANQWQFPASDSALACPRCRRINEPASLFCFSCGLPLDESNAASAPNTLMFPAGLTQTGRPAGFWVRLWAWIIDSAILTVVNALLIAVWPGYSEYFDDDVTFHWVELLCFVIWAGYYTVAVSVWSTTIGKRLLDLYVARTDGSRVGLGRALARYFAYLPSWLILGAGYAMIGLRNDKRGLHDLICDTIVVRK